MTVGRLVGDAGGGPADVPCAAGAARSAAQPTIRASAPGLSMGMSDDFEVAVEEGATVVRVGRALFGERPTRLIGRAIYSAAVGDSSCASSSSSSSAVLWLLVIGRVLISWINPRFEGPVGAVPVRARPSRCWHRSGASCPRPA